MTTVITSPAYPVDYSGRNAANLITNEQQVLTGVTGHDYYFIIPRYAPYFESSLTISFKALSGEVRVLKSGIDYYPTHYFLGASRACASQIYSSITFLNQALVGTVTMSYQTLGGEWVEDTGTIAEVLADRVRNPRITTWEQVVDLPGLFPVVDHAWNLVDMVGMSAVVDALGRVSDAIANAASALAVQHLNDISNPHKVTAEQVGAVTPSQLTAAVSSALAEAGAANTDNLTEGTRNLFFTEARVLGTDLASLPDAGQNIAITKTDTIISALANLQAQQVAANSSIAKCAPSANPTFTGLTAEHLETISATTALTSLDLSQASAWLININVSTSIAFNLNNVKNATGNVLEFAITTINGATGNQAISWPSSVRWADGVTPPRTVAAYARDEYYFYSIDGGATWVGSLSNLNVK